MVNIHEESDLAQWSIRLHRAMNLLIILGSIAFLAFEIQFEPHPAEFGWSLIMIAILTMMSGLIGCISSGQMSCFFPHMFFVFVSFMGLFSLSVLLFVRPEEVARKMLTFHISVSHALRHLFMDAYFFSLLGFLQFLTFMLTYIIHKRAYADHYQDFDASFEQKVQLPTFAKEQPASNNLSMASDPAIILRETGGKQETHPTLSTSSRSLKADTELSSVEHPTCEMTSTNAMQHESETPATKQEDTKVTATAKKSDKLKEGERMREQSVCCTSSLFPRKVVEDCYGTGEKVEANGNVSDDRNHRHDGSLSNLDKTTVTFIYAASDSCWLADERRKACFVSTSTANTINSDSSSSRSAQECTYAISEESNPALSIPKQWQSSPDVFPPVGISFLLHVSGLIFGARINFALPHFPKRLETCSPATLNVTSAAIATGDLEMGSTLKEYNSGHQEQQEKRKLHSASTSRVSANGRALNLWAGAGDVS
ncbi:hypothetical protein R1flu_021290 [Riccia fluitans]|uniref:Transmembrane protein n=1 Tax=Riccia fluitans TaxID=41844 RepID=A0ABD1ZNX8_9MARC